MLKHYLTSFLEWAIGILFVMIGIVNTFWGNDTVFGIFIVLLALLFIPNSNRIIIKKLGIRIPLWSKISIAMFIIWASVGVGELFDKIEMMMNSFK
ncbi:MAG: hypothetical protein ACO3AW_01075 [Chitinophagaceae bacterium]